MNIYWIIILAHGKSVLSFCKCCMNRKKNNYQPWMINRFTCIPFIKYPEQKVFWQILHFYMEIVLSVSGEFWICIPNSPTSLLSWHNFWEQPLSLWSVPWITNEVHSHFTDIECTNSSAWLLLLYSLGEDNSKPGEGILKILAVLENFRELMLPCCFLNQKNIERRGNK